MGTTSFSPRFVRANVSIKIGDKSFPVGSHLVNSSGVPGFDWTHFDPLDTVGRKVQVTVQVMSAQPFEFHCEAYLNCEVTERKHTLGLTFILSAAQATELNGVIEKEGVLPDYVRKFPRIHFVEKVPIFPSRAILFHMSVSQELLIVCDVENVSPTGFQIYTDDIRVRQVPAGEILKVTLQPRGSFQHCVESLCAVKRVIHGNDLVTGNPRWTLGLSIMTVSNEHKTVFTELLRQIVVQMRR